MITDDSLKGISCFVAAVETGSFTAAGQRLHLTSSAVSKSVARLENRLNAVLLERTTRTMTLTDAGRAYYETCLKVMNELSEAQAALAAQQRIPSGRLHIALPHTYGCRVAVPLINQFALHYPELTIRMSFADRFIDLFDEGIDLAVRIGGPSHYPSSIASQIIGDEQLMFFASPDYLQRHGEVRSFRDLSQHHAVVYQHPDGSPKPWKVMTGSGLAVEQEVKYRMAFADAEAQLAAVIAGLGVAQMATWLTREAEEKGLLVRLLPDQVVEGLTLRLVWPVKKQHTPKIDALLTAMNALFIG